MDTIKELVPLTADDIKKLEVKKTKGGYGCLWFSLILFFFAVAATYFSYGGGTRWFYVFAAISALCLLFIALSFWAGPTEDKNVLLDIKEEKKLHIVAQIKSKEIKEVQSRISGLSKEERLLKAVADSYKPLNLVYSMKVHGYTFELTEEQYLTSFRKGEFVEFFAAPHSKTILSAPVVIHE